MKITFLGTGAADWNINEHRDVKDFRRNSSVNPIILTSIR